MYVEPWDRRAAAAVADDPLHPARATTTAQPIAAAVVSLTEQEDAARRATFLGTERLVGSATLHELKIDKGFVGDMHVNPAHAAIVRSIIDLGHNLGLRVVGEGVETQESLDGLSADRCDIAQGYLLARPAPLGDLAPTLDLSAPRQVAA